MVHALEPRRLLASAGLAVNFNDEALWDANFSTAVAQAKALGVTAVRVWLGFNGYGDRPNAYDPPATFGSSYHNGVPDENDAEQAMNRVFDLKDAGFKVMVTVNDATKSLPTSASQVQSFYRHLMDSPETEGGTRTLDSAVDFWEIGNEPDSANYWNPNASSKTVRLQSYVDQLLIPAATELKKDGETVVSAGVSYDPTDLNTVLSRLTSKNATGLIDYAGFHPYGTSTPGGSSQIVDRTNSAVAYAKKAGKPLMATEWNVRGFGTSGTTDTAWAAAMDDAYDRAIKDNYGYAFYFCMINNWSGRGGSTSARPGGLLQHTYSGSVTTTSSISTLKAYYESSLVASQPFFNTFNGWDDSGTDNGGGGGGTTPPNTPQTVISGVVTGAGTASSGLTSVRAFVDIDQDGTYDSTEPSDLADSSGAFSISYDGSLLPTGIYTIRLALPSTLKSVSTSTSRVIMPASTNTGVNFTVAPNGSNTPSGTASIGGKVFAQVSKWNTAVAAASWTVFIDTDKDGKLDTGEKSVKASSSSQSYTFTGLSAGTYRVALVPASGFSIVTPTAKYFTITVTAGQSKTGQNFVVKKN